MKNKIIITIGRQFGSGGREIGKKLSELLGIAYYDKELMALAAKESGLCKELFEKADERVSGNLSYAFSLGYSYMGAYAPYNDILSNDGLFKLQSDAIRSLAEKQACVLVGRCADYILRNDPDCISVFIHNTMENRIKRIMQDDQVSEREAREQIASIDKSRASYYNYYTNKAWGVASSYNLSVDASVLGIDETVLFIKSFVMKKLEIGAS